jgi:hypothetical protein
LERVSERTEGDTPAQWRRSLDQGASNDLGEEIAAGREAAAA